MINWKEVVLPFFNPYLFGFKPTSVGAGIMKQCLNAIQVAYQNCITGV
jgi:hypothetical protein